MSHRVQLNVTVLSDLLSGYAPMDPQLGCVVGSDDVADITIGRISAILFWL